MSSIAHVMKKHTGFDKWSYSHQKIGVNKKGAKYVKGRTHKAPKHRKDAPNTWLSYDTVGQIVKKYNSNHRNFENCNDPDKFVKHPGFLLEKKYPNFVIDIDSETIPDDVLHFLKAYPTLVLKSRSGKPHIIGIADDALFAHLQHVTAKGLSPANGSAFKGDFLFSGAWVVTTLTKHDLSSDDIRTFGLEELVKIVPVLSSETPIPDTSSNASPDAAKLAIFSRAEDMKDETISNIEKSLMSIPTTLTKSLCDTMVKNRYRNIPGSTYDLWCNIGLCLAHTQITLENIGRVEDAEKIIGLFDRWSSRDQSTYPGTKEIEKRYSEFLNSTRKKLLEPHTSFSDSAIQLKSYSSIKHLSKSCLSQFPDMKVVKKKELPMARSEKNRKYLMNREGLSFYREHMLDKYCLKGPQILIDEWFCPLQDYSIYRPKNYSQFQNPKEWVSDLTPFFQDRYGLPDMSDSDLEKRHLAAMKNASSFSLMHRYATSRKLTTRVLNKVIRLIVIDEDVIMCPNERREMYHMIRKCLLAAYRACTRVIEPPFPVPANITIKGTQDIGKSFFFSLLLPDSLDPFFTQFPTTKFKNSKDDHEFLQALCNNFIVQMDEAGDAHKLNEKLKEYATTTKISDRKKYKVNIEKFKKRALLILTTNASTLDLPDDGNRKNLIIETSELSFKKLEQMKQSGEIQQLYAEMEHVISCAEKMPNSQDRLRRVLTFSERQKNLIEVHAKGISRRTTEAALIFEELFCDEDLYVYNPEDLRKKTDDKARKGFFYVTEKDLNLAMSMNDSQYLDLKKLQDTDSRLPLISPGIMQKIIAALGYRVSLTQLRKEMEVFSSRFTKTRPIDGTENESPFGLGSPYRIKKGRLHYINPDSKTKKSKALRYYIFPYVRIDIRNTDGATYDIETGGVNRSEPPNVFKLA